MGEAVVEVGEGEHQQRGRRKNFCFLVVLVRFCIGFLILLFAELIQESDWSIRLNLSASSRSKLRANSG